MSKRARTFVVILGGAIVLGFLLWPKLQALWAEEGESVGERKPEPQATPVNGYVVTPQPFADKVRATGTILPNEKIIVRPEISGKIESIHFEEGTYVQNGQRLITLNDDELQANFKKARHQKELAGTTEKRKRKLLAKEAISQEEYDKAKSELETLRAEVQFLKARLDKTTIHAPFSGVVGLRHVSKGAIISPETQITTLQDIQPVKLDFSLPEKYAYYIEEGDKVHFTVENKTKEFEGTIYAFEPAIETETRTLQIRAIVPNQEFDIMPGMSADISVVLEEIDSTLLVPTTAISPDLHEMKVFKYEKGKAVPQSVKTGIRTPDFIQIKEGLKPNDTVISSGLMNLKPGIPVRLSRIRSSQTEEPTQ